MYRLITVADSLESLVVRRRKKLGFDTSVDTSSGRSGKQRQKSQENLRESPNSDEERLIN